MMAGPAWRDAADVVVIGTGVAGLAAAYEPTLAVKACTNC